MLPAPNVTVSPFLAYRVCTSEYETLTLTTPQARSQFAAKSWPGALPQKMAFTNE